MPDILPGKEVVMTDHKFAAWLRKNDWKGAYQHSGDLTYYLNDTGKTIAVTITDNTACTHRIFIHPDLPKRI